MIRRSKRKLDQVSIFFAVLMLAGGIWGLVTGSIYIPDRHGGTGYSEPGSNYISLALLIAGALMILSGTKTKMNRNLWFIAIAACLILSVAGMIVGPSIR